jgi:hypothetical protein
MLLNYVSYFNYNVVFATIKLLLERMGAGVLFMLLLFIDFLLYKSTLC